MGENVLRVIPGEPDWVPPADALVRAEATFRRLVPRAGSIEVKVYPETTFIDPGDNWDGVRCPRCGRDVEVSWWSQRMSASYESSRYADRSVVMPCCGASSTLNDLDYLSPAGFARAEIAAWVPWRGVLDDDLRAMGEAFGVPAKQIWQNI